MSINIVAFSNTHTPLFPYRVPSKHLLHSGQQETEEINHSAPTFGLLYKLVFEMKEIGGAATSEWTGSEKGKRKDLQGRNSERIQRIFALL